MMKRLIAFALGLAAIQSPVVAQVAISNLPSATTPLSGTEAVPCVQSGITKKCLTASLSQAGTQTANTVLAAPNGSSGAPTFRALLLGDLPVSATGTVLSNVSGSTQVPAYNGVSSVFDNLLGTTQGSFVYRGASTWSALSGCVSGQVPLSQGASANIVCGYENAINVRNAPYSATGLGSADDGPAINNAITAACSGVSHSIYIPAGTYKLSTVSIAPTCGLTIFGDGDATVIAPISTLSAFVWTSLPRVQIQNLAITYGTPGTSGTAGISCSVTTGSSNTGSTIRDVTINAPYIGINLHNCPWFVIDDNRIFSMVGAGVQIDNPTNVDVGDGSIQNNAIFNFGAISGQIGVSWASGGGLRVHNNKFGALQGGVQINLASGAVTSQHYIEDNSFDTMNGYGVQLTRAGTTGTLSNVIINGNVCTSCLIGFSVPTDATGAWLTNLVAVGNSYIGQNSASAALFSINSTNGIMLANNVGFSNNAATLLYTIGSATTGGVIGPNAKTGTWVTNYNGGTSITIIAPN